MKPVEQMKKYPMTALRQWMVETGRTDTDLAAELNALLQGAQIHPRTVGRWRKGISFPRPGAMRKLIELSKDSETRLDANSFLKATEKKPGGEA